MLCEAVLVDREDTCRIKREVVRLVEGDALRSTVDVHTLHRTVTLHDAFAGSVVSITTRLPVVRQHHQLVLLVPVQFSRLIRRVIHHSDRCIFNHFTF